MKKARALVEFFNSSTQALEKLMKVQEVTNPEKKPLKPCQDVVTRWWSTWKMLHRLQYLRRAISALIISDEKIAKAVKKDLTQEQTKVLD